MDNFDNVDSRKLESLKINLGNEAKENKILKEKLISQEEDFKIQTMRLNMLKEEYESKCQNKKKEKMSFKGNSNENEIYEKYKEESHSLINKDNAVDNKIIYKAISKYFENLNSSMKEISMDHKFEIEKNLVEIRCIGVTYLENQQDLFTENQLCQSFRICNTIRIATFIKNALEFWNISQSEKNLSVYYQISENKVSFVESRSLFIDQVYKQSGKEKIEEFKIYIVKNSSKYILF